MVVEMKTLGTVATYINGRAFKPSEWETDGRPIIRIQNLTNTDASYNYSTGEFEEKYLVNNGDLLFAWSASLGAHIWKGKEAWLNQHIFHVVPNEGISRDYLYYYLLIVVADLYSKTHGSGMVHITKKPFMNTPIPVPLLSEQERIVARIEEMFSQLDTAVETLKKTKAQLAVYRQAVLKEAFEGHLTSDWRKNHSSDLNIVLSKIEENKAKKHKSEDYHYEVSIPLSTLPDGWRWVFVGDISKGPEYGTSQKSLKTGKVPVIRMGNLQNGEIVWDDLVFSNDESEIEKYRLANGDVLFNRTNSPELVGKTALFRGEREAIYAGYLIKVNQLECIHPLYLTHYLNSFTARNYGNKVKTDGVNQSNINGTKLCTYPFPLCSIEEQVQVVYELETRLSVCDSIEHTVETALQQAAAMRQSILKQAFEGVF